MYSGRSSIMKTELASMILALLCLEMLRESSLGFFSHFCGYFRTDHDHVDHDSVLLSERWGCKEHFVSGCWHSSGRDRGRYTGECWLSTLGVLHPGVPVMWYGHIRDLSPSAEGCKGGRMPNVTRLH